MTTKIIQVKMNENQRQIIEDFARRKGLPATSFMRFLVLDFIDKNKQEAVAN